MYIGVIGMIGVGKSTLTEALAKRLGYRAYYEPVKENPYLDDFYADQKRWSFPMQIFMLTQRFKQFQEIQDLRRRSVGIVQDQIIFGDVLYGQLTHHFGFMDNRDYATYRSHFETLRPLLALPDVVIHLHTSVPNAMRRIQERGRVSEKAITSEYLTELSRLFTAWVASVVGQTKVIALDWNTFQPTEDVVQNIERELEIQLPLPVLTHP